MGSTKQRALLTLLLLERGRELTSERIIDALWGQEPPPTATKNLHVLVGRLRTALAPERARGDTGTAVVSLPAGYRLDTHGWRVDAWDFEGMLRSARSLTDSHDWQQAATLLHQALAMWRGSPLGSIAYLDWAAPEAARLDEARLEALELRIRADMELGRDDQLVPELEALVAAQPHRERLRALHMLALYRAGRQSDALESYRAARRHLRQELGVEPGEELRKLQRQILQQDPVLARAPTVSGRRVRLPAVPVPNTPTFGRDRDLERLRSIVLDDQVRLLTITGWGGGGKTRAATELARLVSDEFDDVGFIELASLRDASMVPAALSRAFGITQPEGDAIEAVGRFLGDRRILLVLDNFEHVAGAAGGVAQLLEACPRLTVLVTSRTALSLYGEHQYVLEPLRVPTIEQLASGEGIAELAAVRMFESRARETNPEFRIDEQNLSAVARICARVDGLPLGIELAAARAKLLSPTEILARLDHRLTLLTTGSAAMPARQRSLRAAIEWSYELLDPEQQRLFGMLGVFVGGWNVEAAIAVAGVEDTDEIELLDQLEALAARNLISRKVDSGGNVRLSMLETIGEFARELLAGTDGDLLRRRHAEHFLHVAAAGNDHRSTPEAVRARRLLRVELQNVRAAIEWACDVEPELAGRITAELTQYYLTEGPMDEGALLAEHALRHSADMSTATLASLEFLAGTLAFHRAQSEAALQHLRRAVARFSSADSRPGQVRSLVGLAEVYRQREDWASAHEHLASAASLASEEGDRWLVALVLAHRFLVDIDTGPHGAVRLGEEALRLFELEDDAFWANSMRLAILCEMVFTETHRALQQLPDLADRFRKSGQRSMLAHTLSVEARALIEVRRFDAAVTKADRAVSASLDVGDSPTLSFALAMQAVAHMKAGSATVARHAAVENLRLGRVTSSYRFAPYCLSVLGHLAMLDGDHDQAAPPLLALDHDFFETVYDLDVWMAEQAAEDLRLLATALTPAVLEELRRSWHGMGIGQRVEMLLDPQFLGDIEAATATVGLNRVAVGYEASTFARPRE